MAVRGRTDIFPHRIDQTTGANASVEYEHKEVHTGDSFYITDTRTRDSGQVVSYRFQTPNTLEWAHFYFNVESQGQILIEIREAITDVLTPVTVRNRNRNYADNLATVTYDPQVAAATLGTIIWSWNSGTATPAVARTPGTVRSSGEIVLKQATKYELRVTSAFNANIISTYCTWYEHTNVEN